MYTIKPTSLKGQVKFPIQKVKWWINTLSLPHMVHNTSPVSPWFFPHDYYIDSMDLALQIPKVHFPHILSNFSSIVLTLPYHIEPSKYKIPNHLDFFQFLKHHALEIQILVPPWKDMSSRPWPRLWSSGHEGPIIKSMWGTIILVVWEHMVGTTIKDGFYGSFDDVGNKNIFFQSLVSLSNFGTHNTLIEIGQNVTILFATTCNY